MYASAYYIVGGAKSGEGAIITRSPNATDHIAVFSFFEHSCFQTLNSTDPNGWYVLQTNYDWDKKDIYLDDRTIPGKVCFHFQEAHDLQDCMNKLTQENVGLAGLYQVKHGLNAEEPKIQVLSSKPNLNKATVYTAVC